jgi:hypothetical protein
MPRAIAAPGRNPVLKPADTSRESARAYLKSLPAGNKKPNRVAGPL